MNDAGAPTVSILVPTLNEADNIEPILRRIISTIEKNDLDAEVLFVDGGSVDETRAQVNRWKSDKRVRLIESDAKKGLAGDIVAAAEAARGRVIVVLDADLSHPPEVIPQLVKPLLDGSHDMALASRYVRGGSMLDWPWMRWAVSRVATLLVAPLVSVKDPLSGFFAVRRELLLKLARDMAGFKIALEILARGGEALRVVEVPIVFHNRAAGKSKFGVRQIGIFLLQVTSLLGSRMPVRLEWQMAATAAIGLVLDFVLFRLFLAAQASIVVSQISSFLLASAASYGLAAWLFLAPFAATVEISLWRLFSRWALVFFLALSVRNAIFSLVMEMWPRLPHGAILGAALIGAAVLLIGTRLFVFVYPEPNAASSARWRMITVFVVAYVLLLKLVFMGLLNVMPEEAYYWNYSQHLALSYLDHPPMVAWLIWLSTSLLGNSEFSVRLPASIAWIITAVFMFRLTENLFDRSTAFRSVLLLAVLPIYFGVSFFMTPDAALYAAWAGCLYFLERALVAEDRRAWWGAGLCIGFGMLAKYTIALLGLGALIYILCDRQSRKWLLRPQPYLAAVLGTILFSPVLFWNMTNAWASFRFQGSHRWSNDPEFSLHYLLLSLLLVLTPVGLLAVGKLFLTRSSATTPGFEEGDPRRKQYLWMLSFTAVPLLIFVIHSLHNDMKLHWTGPAFLAAVPLLAAGMVPRAGEMGGWLTGLVQRTWMPTIVVLLVAYGSSLYYLSLGLPGSPLSSTRAFGAWRMLAERVGQIEKVIEKKTGSEPVIVGMDKYMMASATSFYDHSDRDAARNTGGPHLFGGKSLMFEYWLPRSAAAGRNLIMIDFEENRLAHPKLSRYFEAISDVVKETLEKDGHVVGYFYWRVGYGYDDQVTPVWERPRRNKRIQGGRALNRE